MNLHGQQIIGDNIQSTGINRFYAINPVTGIQLPVEFGEATPEEVDLSCNFASNAFKNYRNKAGIDKGIFLETIAYEIEELGNDLIERCVAETGLPKARIERERERTISQLRLFARVSREGSWVQASIDTAIPERQPMPKPDIRSMHMALGPVVVFGASNFPLAFSVAGGDTVSALAAGCPVIVKAHPAHPGTCELIATAIIKAAKKTNMPNGVFSMLHGGAEVGVYLVTHPFIKAVGFTGSFKTGKALFDAAAKRKEPIPVYAEMGSVNPVFILPEIFTSQAEQLASGLTNSVTLGVGQFCTNPGLIVLEKNLASTNFLEKVVACFQSSAGGAMITSSIKDAYQRGVDNANSIDGVELLAMGKESESYNGVQPNYLKQMLMFCCKEIIYWKKYLAQQA